MCAHALRTVSPDNILCVETLSLLLLSTDNIRFSGFSVSAMKGEDWRGGGGGGGGGGGREGSDKNEVRTPSSSYRLIGLSPAVTAGYFTHSRPQY